MNSNTIAAVATPPGTGGIGIVRLSGPEAIPVAERFFRSRTGRMISEAKGYSGMLGRVFDDQGELDDAIVFVYRAPASYTGEDVVEISCHGGLWAVQSVLRLCYANGAGPAEPGEFTRRAFLNGKMALSDAESVIQLIEAQGNAAMRAALAARDGVLTGEVGRIATLLVEQSAHLAVWADYPDEEIEPVDTGALAVALDEIIARLRDLLDSWDRGKILRDGVQTVIVGRPNVGKSTLMNLLAGEERSIVTEVPGTTRDVVEDRIRLGDCVLHLADTAGLRQTDDPVERIGVGRARSRAETADLILAVFDSSDELGEEDLALLKQMRDRPCIAVVNKMDLPRKLDLDRVRQFISHVVTISAGTGQGREELERVVLQLLQLEQLDLSAPMVATERQRRDIGKALGSVQEAVAQLRGGVTLDAVNVSIDYALEALLALTGQRASEAVLDEVFSRFCVGK